MVLLLLCHVFTPAFAQRNNELPMLVPNVKGEMQIDGQLDEPQWQQAHVFSLDYVVRPYENTQAPVNTEVRIFEDDTTLYVSFIADDPDPSAISAFFRDRDRIWSDDLVGIKLDTFNDSRLAYQFFVNPFGIQADSIENEMTGRESDSWDAIWQSAGQITSRGYQVELAIPLRILSFAQGTDKKIWGAEFVRFYPRSQRLRISNIPTDRDNACNLCQLSDISGFKQAEQGQSLVYVPTLVLASGRERDLSENQQWSDFENKEVGLDMAWNITPEVSLQATLNPDFSQVESDVAQLSINNTFALFFAEKRPFFLENADYFGTNMNLVYTRNIGSPDYGAKITGRVDNHTLGVFVANDEYTTFVVPGNLGSTVAELEEKSVNVAARYRYDIAENWSIGTVATLREAGDYHNYLYGLDSKYKASEQDTLRVQWVASQTQYPFDLKHDFEGESALRVDDQTELTDSALRLNYRHNQRDWHFRADHNRYGEDFRADMGFQNQVDRNVSVVGGGYRWFNETSWWNRVEVFGDWDISHSNAGELLEKEAEINASINGYQQSYFRLGLMQRERVGLRKDEQRLAIDGNTDRFTEQQVNMYAETRPNPAVFASVYARYGDQIDFVNNRLGTQLTINPRMNLSIGKHLQLSLRHTYTHLEAAGQSVFRANLSDARLTYQFDQRQFVRLIVIYSDVARNLSNYTTDTSDLNQHYAQLGTQLLYSYKVNPLTKFFIGYADSGYRDDAVTVRTRTEQTVFMKFSYAWLN